MNSDFVGTVGSSCNCHFIDVKLLVNPFDV